MDNRLEGAEQTPNLRSYAYGVDLPANTPDKRLFFKQQIRGLTTCAQIFDANRERNGLLRTNWFDRNWRTDVGLMTADKWTITSIAKEWGIAGSYEVTRQMALRLAAKTVLVDLDGMISRGEVEQYYPKTGILAAWKIGKEDRERPQKIRKWRDDLRKILESGQLPELDDLTTILDMLTIKKELSKKR